MKKLTLEDVKEILRVEVRKSILHSKQVHLGTNKYDPEKVEDSLEVCFYERRKDETETKRMT